MVKCQSYAELHEYSILFRRNYEDDEDDDEDDRERNDHDNEDDDLEDEDTGYSP